MLEVLDAIYLKRLLCVTTNARRKTLNLFRPVDSNLPSVG